MLRQRYTGHWIAGLPAHARVLAGAGHRGEGRSVAHGVASPGSAPGGSLGSGPIGVVRTPSMVSAHREISHD